MPKLTIQHQSIGLKNKKLFVEAIIELEEIDIIFMQEVKQEKVNSNDMARCKCK